MLRKKLDNPTGIADSKCMKETHQIDLSPHRLIGRHTAPPSVQQWLNKEEDIAQKWQKEVIEWIQNVQEFQKAAEVNLYKSDNFTDSDLRQHCKFSSMLICKGQDCALIAEEFQLENKNYYLPLIDNKLSELIKALHQWNGKMEDQKDIPESFLQSVEDIKNGNTIDLEKALKEQP